MTMNKPATVTVGMPVYNGEKYISQAIESVLNQTFTDFQLVICDNQSCDSTQEICESYQDPRVHYFRNEKNLGASGNFNIAFSKNQSPYFKWLSHDDLLGAENLERCVALLNEEPTLSIAHCRTIKIDEDGNEFGNYDHDLRLDSSNASERFNKLLWMDYVSELFGLMRADVVKRTRGWGNFPGADRNFVAHMALLGNVGYVEDYLFYYRIHTDNYSMSKTTNADALEWFAGNIRNSKIKPQFTSLIKFREYFHAITHSDLSMQEQLSSVWNLVEWFGGRTYEELIDRQKLDSHGKYRRKIMEKYSR